MRILDPLWAGLATAAFALMFNLRGKDVPLAAVGGALGWTVAAPLQTLTGSQAVAYCAASVVIGIWAEIISAIQKRPAAVYIACEIIPLVPGSGMYYTMLEYVKGNSSLSLATGFATLQAAGAIAMGLALSGAVSRLLSLRSLTRRIHSPANRLGEKKKTSRDRGE
jgi:uncharacterized membrane protein YjjB (DUF3815 family)